jgi:hypothetical protein
VRREQLFILRLWSDSDRVGTWRASLENMRTKEVRYFRSMEELQTFLATPALQALCHFKDEVQQP